MKAKALQFIVVIVILAAIACSSAAWAMDEAVITSTSSKVVANEDNEFNEAMGVWLRHNYSKGEKMLSEFAQKHPDSRWAAEAELHCGCFFTFNERYDEARAVFGKLIANNAKNNIYTKATLRLGNVAEREGKLDEAIGYYASAMSMDTTWDQFKYANFRARKLMMNKSRLLAIINCGPVALEACLKALGKTTQASHTKDIRLSEDGISLFTLSAETQKLGVDNKLAELPIDKLKNMTLPILAYVKPNHFIAVLKINGDKVSVEDSIRGKREMSMTELTQRWAGKVMCFSTDANITPLSVASALDATGGCCAQSDEDECMGDPSYCSQCGDGPDANSCNSCPGGGTGGPNGPGSPGGPGSPSGPGGLGPNIPFCPGCVTSSSAPPNVGYPSWMMNVNNFNVIVRDTPIYYNPGKGPQVAFTLTYSNESSNTGIFGCGWRCQYDMKVFFIPSEYPNYPSLQLHRDNGRIELYTWNGSSYEPRELMANYGYRDTIEKQIDGTVVLSLRGGGKYYFVPEGSADEGRIQYIEDNIGNRITCEYDEVSGNLAHIIDANGGVTDVETTGSGITERVTSVTVPEYDPQTHSFGNGNGRVAEFEYTNGNLTSITDMAGSTSTLSYGSTVWSQGTGHLDQSVTTSSPDDGGDLDVYLGSYIPRYSGSIEVTGAQGSEIISFSSVEQRYNQYNQPLSCCYTLHGITRGSVRRAFAVDDTITTSSSTVPYLSTIVTPSKKTKFTYTWWTNPGTRRSTVIALQDVYECGRNEFSNINNYPSVPTIHYQWIYEYAQPYDTVVTRYPTSVSPTLAGGRSRHYKALLAPDDAAGCVLDELGHSIVGYGLGGSRDRVLLYDANGNITCSLYCVADEGHDPYSLVDPEQEWWVGDTDGKHNLYYRIDPLMNVWAYTYNEDHSIHTETDPYGSVKTYSYDGYGQITKIEDALGVQLASGYDATTHRLIWSEDGREQRTTYNYNEGDERRGFVTSVVDPASKTTSYQYDVKGRRSQITDPEGNVTQFEYDDLDRPTKTTFGSGANDPYTETEYTCCHKDRTIDENGKVTRYVYDLKNRPWVTVSDAKDGLLSANISDSATSLPLVDASSFPSGGGVIVVQHKYEICSGGCYQYVGLEIMTYTGKTGNTLTGVTRAQLGSTAHAFSTDDRVAEGSVVVYGYDSQYLDWMTSLTDALVHTTYYTYYLNGKLETTRYPDNTGERYTYDNLNSGNNMTMKEYGTFSGQTFTPDTSLTVHYEYDDNNRLTRTSH